MYKLNSKLLDELKDAEKEHNKSRTSVNLREVSYRENRLYNYGVSLGEVLLPVYKKNKLIAEVGWVGNLEHSYDQNVIMHGSGLLKVGSNIVLTRINGNNPASAEIVTKNKAQELIKNSEYYALTGFHL